MDSSVSIRIVHIFRWDLDRTYLDTDIHSVRGLIRTALESASEKRNIPGSAALMRALSHHDPKSRVFVLSGSPTQMREVLREKLAMDGVRVESLVLKDNLNNLRRGRLRAVRGQVGYKLPRLLQHRIGLGPAVRETLFGDDSEADALIYATYAAAVSGQIDEHDLTRILEVGGAYPDARKAAVAALRRLGRADCVEDIFIHLDQYSSPSSFLSLGDRVVPVFSWMQAALVLYRRDRLTAGGVARVIRSCMEESKLDTTSTGGLVQDAVRRGLISTASLSALMDELEDMAPLRATVLRALERLGTRIPAPECRPLDLLGWLERQRH